MGVIVATKGSLWVSEASEETVVVREGHWSSLRVSGSLWKSLELIGCEVGPMGFHGVIFGQRGLLCVVGSSKCQ